MSVHHIINDIPTTIGTMVHYKESGSNQLHAAVITALHTETRNHIPNTAPAPVLDPDYEHKLYADLHVFGKDLRHIENVPHKMYGKQGHHWEHITHDGDNRKTKK